MDKSTKNHSITDVRQVTHKRNQWPVSQNRVHRQTRERTNVPADHVATEYKTVLVAGNARATLGNVYHIYQNSVQHEPNHIPRQVDHETRLFRMHHWAPEEYTLQQTIPMLYIFYGSTLASYENWTVNAFAALVSTPHRRRVRVFLSVLSNGNHMVHNAPQDEIQSVSPTSIQTDYAEVYNDTLLPLSEYFASISEAKQDVSVTAVIDYNNSRKAQIQSQPTIQDQARVDAVDYLKQLSVEFRSWNCDWYHERELEIRPWSPGRRSNLFRTCVATQWVTMIRFIPERRLIDHTLHQAKMLHILQGTKHVAQFLGFVRDEANLVSGILVDYQKTGVLAYHLNMANEADNPVCIHRRVKWCKQLVGVVAGVHSKLQQIGTLGSQPHSGVALDGYDNLLMWNRFQQTFTYGGKDIAVLPPENQTALDADAISATASSDVYQLGLFLWRLASNRISGNRRQFCYEARCSTTKGTVCKQPHLHPVQLRISDDQCPAFMQKIVNACRQRDPSERMTAHQILGLFPTDITYPTECEQCSTISTNRASGRRLFSFHEDLSCISCDVCRDSTRPRYFHCSICKQGDYDLCPTCLEDGHYCFDKGHVLQETFPEHRKGGLHHYGEDIRPCTS